MYTRTELYYRKGIKRSGFSVNFSHNNNRCKDTMTSFLSTTNEMSTSAILSTAACSTALLGIAWLAYDYQAWVAFGTGGTPPNLQGYWRMSRYRIRCAWSGDDLTDASRLHKDGVSHIQGTLPLRQHPRPHLMPRTLPQRQHPQSLGREASERLHALPSKYATLHPELLTLDKSIIEGRSTDAIFARTELPGRRKAVHDAILGDEIAHVHPQDNSLHIWLTQADARKVVEAGWGQRFPLSSLGICDEGFIFVYAPRSMEDVDIIEQIVKAGIANLTGVEIS